MPLGTVHSVDVHRLLSDFEKHYGLRIHLLPVIPPPDWARNVARKQSVAEDLIAAMKLAYPRQSAETGAVMIGITEQDMYISGLKWTYAFSFRSEERFAVISTAHLSEPSEDEDKPVTADVLEKRAAKVLARDVGILHFRLQPSNDLGSVLYRYVDETPDLDDIGNEYLESDVTVRADLHVEDGDPCFVLRHYATPTRNHAESGTVTSCSGYYKEPNLETLQVDLRYGLLLDQRTDFWRADRIPLELTRVLRTQDERSRAFGIGGNHNLNVFLVGDKWPFTWMDLILEHGGRSHFRRSNWGFGYWDARYTNRDLNGSMFSGSTINWGWPGWNLKHAGMTYTFPDPKGASRPEQAALTGIRAYDGKMLALIRDAAGDLLRARSPAGHELDFKYDPNHRIVEAVDREGGHFEYSYDAAGHLQRVRDSDQHVTEYGYDQSGRLNLFTEDGAQICALTYDEKGRVQSESIPGHTYSFRYFESRYVGFQVDIGDSVGPLRRIRIAPTEYSLDILGADEKR